MDSVVETTRGEVANKFVMTYNSTGIFSIERFANVFGLMSLGKIYFYGSNISSTMMESEFNDIVVITNPVNEVLNLSTVKDLNFDIVYLKGEILLTRNTWQTIDVSSLGKGLYLLLLKGEQGTLVKKVVKE